ncbi:nuclear transport factor 2 family protein [Acrocarpospora catenulata]|uniref:nuclear transport factor 2 family protein n=1 Tax=Acrocarpospora catenulata TaxID=2836182 RepID=UPI001BDB66C9|nr:nuclear transport factor 2 family protein [Acrocarpospora catenulata]
MNADRPTTPAEIFSSALGSLRNGDVAGWVDLCAEDVVFEFPYAPAGRPRRLEGKEAVASYLGVLPGSIEVTKEPQVTVHQTVDPDKAVIEMEIEGRVAATGAPYAQSYVVVLTVADGLITRYRDYWNPLVVLDMEPSA